MPTEFPDSVRTSSSSRSGRRSINCILYYAIQREWPPITGPHIRPEKKSMCQGDDRNCPDFEEHRRNFLNTMDHERRSFLKSAFAAAGGAGVLGAGGLSLVTPSMAAAAQALQPERTNHYHLP